MSDPFIYKECFAAPVTALGIVMLHFRNWKSMPDLYIHPKNERFPKYIQGKTKNHIKYVLGNIYFDQY